MHWPQRSSFWSILFLPPPLQSLCIFQHYVLSTCFPLHPQWYLSFLCFLFDLYLSSIPIFQGKRPYVQITPSTGNWVPHLCCVLLTSLNSHEREQPPESARPLSEGSWIKLIHRGMGYRNYGTVIKHFCLNVASCQVRCLIIQAGIPKISWQLQRASACVCERASRRRCCGVIVTGDAL